MCLESQLFLVLRPRWLRGTGDETGPVFQKAGKREVLGTRLQKRVRIYSYRGRSTVGWSSVMRLVWERRGQFRGTEF